MSAKLLTDGKIQTPPPEYQSVNSTEVLTTRLLRPCRRVFNNRFCLNKLYLEQMKSGRRREGVGRCGGGGLILCVYVCGGGGVGR